MRGGAAAIRGREGKHNVSNAECLEAGLGRMERAKELIYRCRVQSPCSKPVASLVRSEALLFDGGINHEASIMVRRTSSVSSRGPRRCPRRPPLVWPSAMPGRWLSLSVAPAGSRPSAPVPAASRTAPGNSNSLHTARSHAAPTPTRTLKCASETCARCEDSLGAFWGRSGGGRARAAAHAGGRREELIDGR